MEYDEEDWLRLSGLQHFSFCRRQWALIDLEGQWQENLRTTQGHILHENAHDASFTEKRGDVLVTRNLPVFSRTLGITGACDVVEFHALPDGIALSGRDGTWLPCPVEYKRGAPKENPADRLQLCAQAMCLEEMLLCGRIDRACLYYGETRRRQTVALDETLREQVRGMLLEMHALYRGQHTPQVKPSKSCNACSLRERCLPGLLRRTGNVRAYLDRRLEEGWSEA